MDKETIEKFARVIGKSNAAIYAGYPAIFFGLLTAMFLGLAFSLPLQVGQLLQSVNGTIPSTALLMASNIQQTSFLLLAFGAVTMIMAILCIIFYDVFKDALLPGEIERRVKRYTKLFEKEEVK